MSDTTISDAALPVVARYVGTTSNIYRYIAEDLAVVDAQIADEAKKPEAVRLRDELRERAEFEAWAESEGFGKTKFKGMFRNVALQSAWEAWQAALAATGKQHVGENPAWRDELVREAHARGLMEGLNSPRPQQIGEVQGIALPKTRDELIPLALEIIRQLDLIDGHYDAAIEKCKADLAARQTVCATCNGSRVDPGGKPVCRDCVDARQPVGHDLVPYREALIQLHHAYDSGRKGLGYTRQVEALYDAITSTPPGQGVDLGQFIALAKFGEEFAFSAEKQPHSRVVYSQASRLLAMIEEAAQ